MCVVDSRMYQNFECGLFVVEGATQPIFLKVGLFEPRHHHYSIA